MFAGGVHGPKKTGLSPSKALTASTSNLPLALLQGMAYILRVEVKGESMPGQRIDLPQGTLDLLILRTVALEPQHGWAIAERVQQMSSDVLRIQQGSLYPALHRLERKGWIKAHWGTSENNRRAKYYNLTKTGHRQLEAEQDAWEKLTAAVAQVLGTV
jgi:transcriptional regulator